MYSTWFTFLIAKGRSIEGNRKSRARGSEVDDGSRTNQFYNYLAGLQLPANPSLLGSYLGPAGNATGKAPQPSLPPQPQRPRHSPVAFSFAQAASPPLTRSPLLDLRADTVPAPHPLPPPSRRQRLRLSSQPQSQPQPNFEAGIRSAFLPTVRMTDDEIDYMYRHPSVRKAYQANRGGFNSIYAKVFMALGAEATATLYGNGAFESCYDAAPVDLFALDLLVKERIAITSVQLAHMLGEGPLIDTIPTIQLYLSVCSDENLLDYARYKGQLARYIRDIYLSSVNPFRPN